MSFTTKELLELGLTEEQAKQVFALRGAEIKDSQSALDTITAERDSLKSQLEHNQAEMKKLQDDVELSKESKDAFAKLQQEFDDYKKSADETLQQTIKTDAIKLAIKDTDALDTDLMMKLIDVNAVELDDNGKPQLETIINDLQESKPFLFAQAQEPSEQGNSKPTIFNNGNPAANPAKTEVDPFQAIVDSYQ
ncbi:TPA: phage scaffolding protein [Streptococcus agalactiae]|uniref:Scaffolding protein n=1 Tax=Streptococcus agalactiae TaxID=1311 RepID=A0A0H1YHP5_STRAG|nr:phage scaffolding protein [Streptococcus agalactiae]EPT38501.1 scaffold protein [Streptococcus agalactiae FSL S3-603]EPT90721.1 scaffold protein [Streptococcus agalactiae BSU178]KLJ84252.1 scaffolding protein [Streptococcus agalactiae]KLL24183.1 scaffolding protein [Streptococcus agalactiae]KLL30081.1 scaffolding protein [Streptococcus agalactiae]